MELYLNFKIKFVKIDLKLSFVGATKSKKITLFLKNINKWIKDP